MFSKRSEKTSEKKRSKKDSNENKYGKGTEKERRRKEEKGKPTKRGREEGDRTKQKGKRKEAVLPEEWVRESTGDDRTGRNFTHERQRHRDLREKEKM